MAPSTQSPSVTQQPVASHEQYKMAKRFIEKHRAGALGTTDEHGKPQVSIIYCLVEPDLTMYFSTRVEGRKFHNLTVRPTVSLAFSDEEEMATIQMMGVAERVERIEIEQQMLHELFKLRFGDPNWPIPPVKLFEIGATIELAIVKITPTEMTFANYGTPAKGHYKPFFQKIV